MRFRPALLWLFWVTGIIGLMLIFRHFLRWMTALPASRSEGAGRARADDSRTKVVRKT